MRSSRLDTDVRTVGPSRSAAGRVRLVGFPPDGEPTWRADLAVELRSYADATAMPLAYNEHVPHQIVGAVYDRDGGLILDSERAKRNRAWAGNFSQLSLRGGSSAARIPGRTFFGGHLRASFGHVLLEVVPRFWPEHDYPAYDTVVFYPTRVTRRAKELNLEGYAAALLRALDVDPAKARLISGEPVVFDELTVSTAPFLLQRGFSPSATVPFERIAQRFATADGSAALDPPPRRVYLSRSHLETGRRAANEDAIEAVVRRAGFTILHPQEFPIETQVAAVRSAEAVAGCDGSALHLAAFAKPGTKLLAIDSRIVTNQFMLDHARQLDAVHVLAVDRAIGSRTDTWVADVAMVLRGLDLLELTTRTS